MTSRTTSSCFLLLFLAGCSNSPDNEIAASGTIEATEVTVSAKVGGQLLRLAADEGTGVRPGDTLAIVDPSDYEIQLRQTDANYEAMKAQHIQAEAGFTSAQEDFRRMEELWKTKSVTRKQYDDAQTHFAIARQNIAVSRARRDQARAQLEAAAKKLSDCYITAPTGGIVTQKAVEQGEMVTPGGAILRVSRLDRVYLMIYVTEQELGRVKLGQEARIAIDAYRDRTFPGKIVYISPIAEFTPKNIQTKEDRTKLVFGVKIEVDNAGASLKPGMPADATVVIR